MKCWRILATTRDGTPTSFTVEAADRRDAIEKGRARLEKDDGPGAGTIRAVLVP